MLQDYFDFSRTSAIIGIVFFGVVTVIGLIMMYYITVFRFRVRHFYQLSGDAQFHEGKTFKARKLKVGRGKGGLYELWVPKMKQFVTYYGKKMGKNLFYYAEGPDGYLYNVVLGDLDTAKGVLDIEPINRDVRAFHLNGMIPPDCSHHSPSGSCQRKSESCCSEGSHAHL